MSDPYGIPSPVARANGPSDPERTGLLLSSALMPGGSDIHSPGATAPASDPDGTTSPALMLLPAKIGRYTVVREVARGGMGVILAGRDEAMGREVAIKVMLETHAGRPGYRERFVEEARITSSLQHPGVMPVYEFGELPDARPFFAMPLVDGETLDSLLAAQPDPAPGLPHHLQTFARVCQAVAYAHSQGIIHRDLKPLNVMVGRFGVVNVMDWGVASRAGGAERRARNGGSVGYSVPNSELRIPSCKDVIGTPAYMSPEQAQGDNGRVDERADVFGLGGILCAILTGKPPYTGSQTRKVYARAARADLAEAFARLDAAAAARELVWLAKRCLSPQRDARPRDAGEVAEALADYLDSDLRQSARDMLRFFELSPELFCIAGLDGFFRRVNGNFTRVLGYSPGELISRPFVEFVHPADRAGTQRETEKLARGLPVVQFRNRYRDVRGGYRWFEWEAKSIPEEGVIFAVARDITARMEWEGN